MFQNYFLREFWDTLYIYIHSKLVELRGQHYHKALTCQRYWLNESGVVREMEETGPHVKETEGFFEEEGRRSCGRGGKRQKDTSIGSFSRGSSTPDIATQMQGARCLPRDGMNLSPASSPPLQYRLFRGMRPLPFEDRSLHAVYSYLKDRVFDDEETTEPTKRKERGGGPNFIPNPRNLLSSPVQVAKRNPFP